jgi:hypothetical protein
MSATRGSSATSPNWQSCQSIHFTPFNRVSFSSRSAHTVDSSSASSRWLRKTNPADGVPSFEQIRTHWSYQTARRNCCRHLRRHILHILFVLYVRVRMPFSYDDSLYLLVTETAVSHNQWPRFANFFGVMRVMRGFICSSCSCPFSTIWALTGFLDFLR